jgi:hypothetical protein
MVESLSAKRINTAVKAMEASGFNTTSNRAPPQACVKKLAPRDDAVLAVSKR